MNTKHITKLFVTLLCLSTLFASMLGAQAFVSLDEDAALPSVHAEQVYISEEPVCGAPTALSEDELNLNVPAVDETSQANYQAEDVGDTMAAFAYPINDYAAVRSIHAYPIAYCEETKQYYNYASIKASAYWNFQNYGSTSIALTNTQKNDLNQRLLTELTRWNSSYTYRLAGWKVESNHEFYSQKSKLYAEYNTNYSCLEGTQTMRQNIPYSGEVQIIYTYLVDPAVTTYQYVGFTGGFYRILPYGGASSMYIGAGLALNK